MLAPKLRRLGLRRQRQGTYYPHVAAPPALARVLQELSARLPARVQKLSLADDGRVLVELFVGEKLPLVVDPRPPAPGLVLGAAQLPRGDRPPREQGALRKELVPSRLAAVDLDSERALLRLRFERPDAGVRSLLVELSTSDPRAVLTGAYESGERVLSVVGGLRPADGRDLRRGRPYEPPRAPGPLPDVAPSADGHAAAAHAKAAEGASRLKELRERVKAEHRRVQRLVKALEGDLAKHGDPDALARDGELLKTRLGSLSRGDTYVDVTDWEGHARRVALDPALSPQDNLARLFVRSRKAREGRARVLPRLDDARARLEALEEARGALREASIDDETLARVLALLEERKAAASPRRRAALEGPRRPFRAFRVSRNVIARVGRSAKDNDELTLHLAKGNDMWLHARGVAGSHVIVPCDKSGELPPDVLLDAAHLAAWFSPLRKADRVDVQYTQRKHLRKPGKGAPAGLVLVPKERVLHLRVEEERIRRLLENEIAPE